MKSKKELTLQQRFLAAVELYDGEVDRLREKYGREVTHTPALDAVVVVTASLVSREDDLDELVDYVWRAVETAYRLGREQETEQCNTTKL